MSAGCLGYSLDKPETVEVEYPAPPSDIRDAPSRRTCESQSESISPLSKGYFLNAWGEPKERVTSINGETWVYEENGRWCGLWLGLIIIPIPLVLPVCETFDNVYFEGDVAVSIKSRRFTRSTAGVFFDPRFLFFPVPVSARTVKENENRSWPVPESPQENTCGI